MSSPGVRVKGGVGDGEAVAVGVSVGGGVEVDVGGSGVAVGEGDVTAGDAVVRGLQAERARTNRGANQ